MKKCKKLLALTMAVLLAFACFALPSFAASSGSQYGLEATIVTDKENYKANEEIHVTVTVKNTNDFKVEDVSIESLLPETLTLKDGSSSTKTVDLEAGETLTLSFTAVKEKEETSATVPESEGTTPTESETVKPSESETDKPTEIETVKPSETETAKPSETETIKPTETQQPSTQESTEQPTQAPTTEKPTQTTTTAPFTTGEATTLPSTTGTPSTTGGGIIGNLTTTFPKVTTTADSATTAQAENPNTGDSMSVKTLVIAIIALLAVIAVVIILMYKYKKQTTKIISLVMCVAISASAITGVTFFTAKGADDNRKSFTVEKMITVDGEETNVSAEVKYQENKIDPDTGIEFIYFTTSEPIDVLVGEKTAVTFEAKISNPQSIPLDKIQVTDEAGNDVGYLYDNGVKPDESANDGIYIGTFELYSDKEKKVEYSAHINGASAKKTISFYIPVTDNEWNAFQNILDNLKDIEETHVGNSKELLDRAENYLKSNNEVENYTRGTETIQFTTKNGMKGMFTLPIESDISDSTKALSNFRLEQTSVQANSTKNFSPSHVQKIAVIQPYDGTDDRFTNHLEDSANKIAKETGATVSIFNGQETYEQFKHLQNFDMILINTHGSLDEESDTPLICFSTIDDNKELRKDNDLNRVFVDQNRLVYVLPSFFSFYYGCKGEPNSFKDAFMYLGGCYGLKSTALAEILMEAGIKCFVGYTNIVSFKFEREMANQLFDEMTKNNSVNDVFSTTFKGKTEDPNRPGTRIAKVGDYRVFSNPKPADSFSGGQGTINNPYQIATAEQLDAVRYNLNSNFVLVNDIDLSEYENWEPIGGIKDVEAKDGFQGTFDGKGYTIKNLKMDYQIKGDEAGAYHKWHFGLFSNTQSSPGIKNVNLEDVNISIQGVDSSSKDITIGAITTESSVVTNCNTSGIIRVSGMASNLSMGGIVVQANRIINCKNSTHLIAATDGTNINIGGIACRVVSQALIDNCDNFGNINGFSMSDRDVHCGGIVAYNNGTDVTNCNNFGSIEASDYNAVYVGGIIAEGNWCKVLNCSNTGALSGRTYSVTGTNAGSRVGGIIATLEGAKDRNENISKCVNFGTLTSISTHPNRNSLRPSWCGGILGQDSIYANVKNCYNLCTELNAISRNSEKEGESYIGRICGDHWTNEALLNNYSLDSTTLNGSIPTEDIGPDQKNGGSMTKAEIEKAIQDLGFELPSELPAAS